MAVLASEGNGLKGERHSATGSDGRRFLLLCLAAIGIAFGDIGTSPLYALREAFHAHSVMPARDSVLGILSLITWSLLLVVSLKYLILVLRADNHGEGGILALTALALRLKSSSSGQIRVLMLFGLVGTALLYGDGMITPAISVLSAVEGLGITVPALAGLVKPVSVFILVSLFVIQRFGTNLVGRAFGPVMLVWFLVLAVLGVSQIVQAPAVLSAINPMYAVSYFADNGWRAFLVLGSVFLVVTGAEALYADIGHFGKAPIRLPWFSLALPALLLNYWGQGALILVQPEAVANPFFLMAPAGFRMPLVILATLAATIASQALISAVFSLTRQAIQLGFSPRMTVRHTSESVIGQVYVPAVNWLLMLACISLVLLFGSSDRLAAAYGIAVSASMVITVVLLATVMRSQWGWPRWSVALLAGPLLLIDVAFLGSNLLSITSGGWVPLLVGALVFTLMNTWRRGREVLRRHQDAESCSFTELRRRMELAPPAHVAGTAVYMSATQDGAPSALLLNLAHNNVLHDKVLLVTVVTTEKPRVQLHSRMELTELWAGVHKVVLRYGFAESPHVHRDLRRIHLDGERLNAAEFSYFLGHETVLPTPEGALPLWQERLFAVMAQNAQPATAFFNLPVSQTVEFGAQVRV